MREDYSLTFPPHYIASYSFIPLSELGRRGANENVQASKRQQRGFEPGRYRLRVRHTSLDALIKINNVTYTTQDDIHM